MLIVFEFIKVEWRDLIDFFGRGELRKLELMQLSLKPVKRRHQLYQPSIKRNQKIKNKSLKPVNRGINCANVQILNIQRQEFQAVDYCFGKRAVTSSMVGSCTSEIIFIVFLSPISHINGDIAAAAYLWWIKERAIYRIPYS